MFGITYEFILDFWGRLMPTRNFSISHPEIYYAIPRIYWCRDLWKFYLITSLGWRRGKSYIMPAGITPTNTIDFIQMATPNVWHCHHLGAGPVEQDLWVQHILDSYWFGFELFLLGFVSFRYIQLSVIWKIVLPKNLHSESRVTCHREKRVQALQRSHWAHWL